MICLLSLFPLSLMDVMQIWRQGISYCRGQCITLGMDGEDAEGGAWIPMWGAATIEAQFVRGKRQSCLSHYYFGSLSTINQLKLYPKKKKKKKDRFVFIIL